MYHIYVDYMKNHPELGNEPFDIEDLVNIGRTKRVYVSRSTFPFA